MKGAGIAQFTISTPIQGRILVAPPDRSADPVGIQAISNRMKYDGKATEVLLS